MKKAMKILMEVIPMILVLLICLQEGGPIRGPLFCQMGALPPTPGGVCRVWPLRRSAPTAAMPRRACQLARHRRRYCHTPGALPRRHGGLPACVGVAT